MPTFCNCSAFRESAGNISIALKARHVLVSVSPSANIHTARGRIPENVDVTVGSDLVFTLSGAAGSARVSGDVIQRSAVARHIVNYFKLNSRQLGLSTVTDVYIDDDDGRAKFSMTSSRHLRVDKQASSVQLLGIDLRLGLKAVAHEDMPAIETFFSAHAYLPLVSLLDCVVEKFVVHHLVKRYPLIFGPWRSQLDLEAAYIPYVVRSITAITERSTNSDFHKTFRRHVKKLRKAYVLSTSAAADSLREYLGPLDGEEDMDPADESDSSVLCHSLERLFRQGIRPALFKGSQASYIAERGDEQGLLSSAEGNESIESEILCENVNDILQTPQDSDDAPCDLELAEVEMLLALDNDDWPWDSIHSGNDPDMDALDDDGDSDDFLYEFQSTSPQCSQASDPDETLDTPDGSQIKVGNSSLIESQMALSLTSYDALTAVADCPEIDMLLDTCDNWQSLDVDEILNSPILSCEFSLEDIDANGRLFEDALLPLNGSRTVGYLPRPVDMSKSQLLGSQLLVDDRGAEITSSSHRSVQCHTPEMKSEDQVPPLGATSRLALSHEECSANRDNAPSIIPSCTHAPGHAACYFCTDEPTHGFNEAAFASRPHSRAAAAMLYATRQEPFSCVETNISDEDEGILDVD
ncbi:uncharacterized protein LAESUDRAFT_754520 [Laetiporus sulphureus 93-53]|uniref:Uncharacterized protein n=1 Tax=Laetiporus sulphureus 93-53 TaxID=1314785 RepID=A0A165HP06_9APHY|nr:uncharacterized protein LAESUDRAFT_754520 [Laetiporus sulphureus 93-53]KZT11991.1 hypothetical protein LAESUDRAFT_754520 [Laetiporus sulphureus 93-53]